MEKENIVDVLITEISSGTLIARYPIVLAGQNYTPTEQEYFNEAWRCAVEDGLVKGDRRYAYRINIAQQ